MKKSVRGEPVEPSELSAAIFESFRALRKFSDCYSS